MESTRRWFSRRSARPGDTPFNSSDCPEQDPLPVITLREENIISVSKEKKTAKILMKADPGMGKTTQCKKRLPGTGP